MATEGTRDTKYGYQDGLDLVEVDWDGNVVWEFTKHDYIQDPGYDQNGWLVSIMTTKEKAIQLVTMYQAWMPKLAAARP